MLRFFGFERILMDYLAVYQEMVSLNEARCSNSSGDKHTRVQTHY